MEESGVLHYQDGRTGFGTPQAALMQSYRVVILNDYEADTFLEGVAQVVPSSILFVLVTLLGLLGSAETAALGSIALVLGGIVSLGSNVSTLRQTEAAISAAEARRARLIGNIDLRLVHDAPLKLM